MYLTITSIAAYVCTQAARLPKVGNLCGNAEAAVKLLAAQREQSGSPDRANGFLLLSLSTSSFYSSGPPGVTSSHPYGLVMLMSRFYLHECLFGWDVYLRNKTSTEHVMARRYMVHTV